MLAISGDTVDCEGVGELAQQANLLVQCCYLAETEVKTSDQRILSDQVLAFATQAATIAKVSQVGRMVLTHLSPKSTEMLEEVLKEARTGHEIDMILGEDLMALDV